METTMAEPQAFAPDWLSPPGETIADLLEEGGLSQAEFAERTGFTRKHVNDLVRGRAAITADAALRLERVLGSTADFWLTREAQYREALERRRALEALEEEAGWLKELPVAEMVRRGWVERFTDKARQVAECLRFFGVASVEAWRVHYERPLAAFRASPRFANKVGAAAAWLRQAERQAGELRCQTFDKARFKATVRELRALTNEPEPEEFIPSLKGVCAACGVAVVFVPAPKGCPASGATRWLTPTRALLVLSLRHKTNDHLWFTFFHEAGHLLLHGKKMLFVDLADGLDGEYEAEADRFARDLLISPAEARKLAALSISKAKVRAFAGRIGVAPGIVVGRMQWEGWLPWSHLNDLKVRYEWTDGEGGS